MRYAVIFLILLVASYAAVPEEANSGEWPAHFFKGYTSSLHGGGFSYHSPQPDVRTSLLVRAQDSKSYIEWQTQTLPPDYGEPAAAFVWIFGIDVTEDGHSFELSMNGKELLSFSNPRLPEKRPWSVAGTGGAKLEFNTTLIDRYEDAMGYAILTVPRELLVPGKPQVLRVTGESARSSSWYMTFESGVEERSVISQEDAVVRLQSGSVIPVVFGFVHLGNALRGTIEIPSVGRRDFELAPGYTAVRMDVPEVKTEKEYRATVSIAGLPAVEKVFTVKPVRHWMVYFVEHTHTDIGYTRPQTEILPEHLRYIDYALDYCDQTDSYPDDARFRWTCEASWAVREYLNARPAAQIERLIRRVREGRIEVAALFFNMSDMFDEPSLAASLEPIRQFKAKGITVKTAMQDDVNGAAWCLVDYLKGVGVRYFTMGQNSDRAIKPFSRPTAFWWESPSGNRILANRPEHYMWGNNLGILSGDLDGFGKSLLGYLSDLAGQGYPFDRFSIQFSGYNTDNSPPSTAACEIVRQWNSNYEWPKIRLATVHEFLEYLESDHAKELPCYRAAWPDWWTDGFGSAALETAFARKTHSDFIANEGLLSMAALLGARIPGTSLRAMRAINDATAFYDEHTFGAAESISDPRAENTVVQWGEKGAYVWEAVKKNRMLREEAMGLVQPFIARSDVPTIVVFNTLNWKRSAVAEVYIDHQILPPGKSFRIVASDGSTLLAQPLMRREEGTYWALYAEGVPPMGYRTYRIEVSDSPRESPKGADFTGSLENEYYKISFEGEKGGIKSLYDKALRRELVDSEAPWGFSQFIYERLGKNRDQISAYTLEEYTRRVWSAIRMSRVSEGPLWQSVTMTGSSPGCADEKGVACEIRLFRPEKRIEMLFSLRKLPVTDPEGAYVAFPFSFEESRLVFEVQGGTVVPGKDQLEGSASDWDGIQNFASIRGKGGQVVFVSPEIPLVQLGDINLGKFRRVAEVRYPHIYSWVLNNYWTTNFRASQEGELKWRYELTSTPDSSNTFATRFGWGSRIPLLCRVLPAARGITGRGATDRSLLGLDGPDILLVAARPSSDSRGIILLVRETSGRPSDLILGMGGKRTATEVNAIEEPMGKAASRVKFRPFETKFIRIGLE